MKNETGSLICRYRDENNMTQVELAGHLGITQPFLSQIEAGKRKPSFQLLRKIARATGGSLADLLLASRMLRNPSGTITEQQRQAFSRLANGESELKDELGPLSDVIGVVAGPDLIERSLFCGPDGRVEYESPPRFPTHTLARRVFGRVTDLVGEFAQCLRLAFHEVIGRAMGGLEDVPLLLNRVLCTPVFDIEVHSRTVPLASYHPSSHSIELARGQGQHPYFAAHEMIHKLIARADSLPRAYTEDRTIRELVADRGVFDLVLPTERVSKHIVRSRIPDSTYRFMAATDLGVTVRMLEFRLLGLGWLSRSAMIRSYAPIRIRMRRAKGEGYYALHALWRNPIEEEFGKLQREGVLR